MPVVRLASAVFFDQGVVVSTRGNARSASVELSGQSADPAAALLFAALLVDAAALSIARPRRDG